MSSDPNAPIPVKIGIPNKIPSQDPARVGKYDLLVPVEYGQFNRTMITIPEETANPGMIDQVVRETISKLKLLGNRTINV